MSAIQTMLTVMRENPEGISAQRLYHIVHKRRAICEHGYVNVLLCQLVKKRQARILNKSACGECGKKNNMYALTALGKQRLLDMEKRYEQA